MKIVILGSCRHSPYEVLAAPKPLSKDYHNETGYHEACKIFYPAIENADVVWVYLPNGKPGEHTQRDLDYARSKGKQIFYIVPDEKQGGAGFGEHVPAWGSMDQVKK